MRPNSIVGFLLLSINRVLLKEGTPCFHIIPRLSDHLPCRLEIGLETGEQIGQMVKSVCRNITLAHHTEHISNLFLKLKIILDRIGACVDFHCIAFI